MNVLVVDDDAAQRRLVTWLLEEQGYDVITAGDGLEAIDRLRQSPSALVVCDWDLPGISGVEVCRMLRGEHSPQDLCFIMVTARHSQRDRRTAFAAGVDQYMIKPVGPAELAAQVEIGRFVVTRTPEERRILAMARVAESRDPCTGSHLKRIRSYCRVLADQLRTVPDLGDVVDEDYVKLVYVASPLHDIGKMAIPGDVLLKPGKVNQKEFEILKAHTLQGAATLDTALDRLDDSPLLRMARDIAISHHERYDGSGYPHGLAGDEIPLCGRIAALADVYDALTSRRIYRRALRHEEARAIIVNGAGTAFAPYVVQAFLDREDDFQTIGRQYSEVDRLAVDLPAVAYGHEISGRLLRGTELGHLHSTGVVV
ncbi:MAG: response regulator [Pirellulaceae bacterium]|nr:response regulator [Pirellulaceae bacterium]